MNMMLLLVASSSITMAFLQSALFLILFPTSVFIAIKLNALVILYYTYLVTFTVIFASTGVENSGDDDG